MQMMYNVFPSVVMAGRKSKITVEPKHQKYDFKEKKYILTVIPLEKRDVKRNPVYRIDVSDFNQLEISPKDGMLSFEYDFRSEQEYGIHIKTADNKSVFEFSVYALDSDLYGTFPYKGDLHFHSVRSDGTGELPEIAGALRGLGYDFLCLTDHHKLYPSAELKKMYEGVNTGFTVFLGEEVHNADMGYFHIVNFDGKYSVNDVLEADYENLRKKLLEEAKTVEVADGIDPVEYVYRKWMSDEIRKSGGKVIFPHPYWKVNGEYHTETHSSIYTIKKGLYDIFEVLGGCSPEENNIQVALYNELRAEGIDLPIVGSTDSHGLDSSTSDFNHAYTLVFAKSPKEIPNAIMNRKSVAVENLPNENPRVYGHFRLVKYALFLIRNFYPEYMELTSELGEPICAYGETGKCKDDIESISSKITEFRNRYFQKHICVAWTPFFQSLEEKVELRLKGTVNSNSNLTYALYSYDSEGVEHEVYSASVVPSENGSFENSYSFDPISLAVYENAEKFRAALYSEEEVTEVEISEFSFKEVCEVKQIAEEQRVLPGNLTMNAKDVKKVLFVGNSILLGMFNTYGMCASSPKKDYAYLVQQKLLEYNKDCVFYKLHGSGFEHGENMEAFEAWFSKEDNVYTGMPAKDSFTEDLDLILIQLTDNVNTDAKIDAFRQKVDIFMERIKKMCPKARIIWIHGWFNKQNTVDKLVEVCERWGLERIDISDFHVKENESYSGQISWHPETGEMTVKDTWITHPGDKGMEKIAQRIIEVLGVESK